VASINIRVDDGLKERAYSVLAQLGLSPSDAIRQFLTYVSDNGKLPIKAIMVSDEDAELIAIVQQRLQSSQPVRVTLEDL
jgi:RHH-type rel operon transcriptional repressor/antitoxin RelB